MLILVHVIIALSSVIFGTILLFSPSKTKLNISYVLIASTLISGTILVVATHSSVLRACLSGLVYVTIVTGLTLFARQKLATEHSKLDKTD